MTRFGEEVRKISTFDFWVVDWRGLQGGKRRCGAISWHVSTAGAQIIVNLTAAVVTAFSRFRGGLVVCLRHRLIPRGGNLETEEPSVKPNICNCWLLNRQLLVARRETMAEGWGVEDRDRGLRSSSSGESVPHPNCIKYGPIFHSFVIIV